MNRFVASLLLIATGLASAQAPDGIMNTTASLTAGSSSSVTSVSESFTANTNALGTNTLNEFQYYNNLALGAIAGYQLAIDAAHTFSLTASVSKNVGGASTIRCELFDGSNWVETPVTIAAGGPINQPLMRLRYGSTLTTANVSATCSLSIAVQRGSAAGAFKLKSYHPQVCPDGTPDIPGCTQPPISTFVCNLRSVINGGSSSAYGCRADGTTVSVERTYGVDATVTPVSPILSFTPPSGSPILLPNPMNTGAVGSTAAAVLIDVGITSVANQGVSPATTSITTSLSPNPPGVWIVSANPGTYTGGNPAPSPSNVAVSCVRQSMTTATTLTVHQTMSNGTPPQDATYNVTCEAGAPSINPAAPQMSYRYGPTDLTQPNSVINPPAAPNPSSPLPFFVDIGCPNDGAGVQCGGTAGVGATTTVSGISATYLGSAVPSPVLNCGFVTEAGAAAGSQLAFNAIGSTPDVDAGDLRCTCPTGSFQAESFSVSVTEASVAPPTNLQRSFRVVCPVVVSGGAACSASISQTATLLNNALNVGGGGPVPVVQVSGTPNPLGSVQHVFNCQVGNATLGATFSLSTNPAPLTLTGGTTTGSVSAACSNSSSIDATATVSCTSSVVSGSGCTTIQPTSYQIICPGVVPPNTGGFGRPIPSMDLPAKVLLAGLLLLLGFVAVSVRVRP